MKKNSLERVLRSDAWLAVRRDASGIRCLFWNYLQIDCERRRREWTRAVCSFLWIDQIKKGVFVSPTNLWSSFGRIEIRRLRSSSSPLVPVSFRNLNLKFASVSCVRRVRCYIARFESDSVRDKLLLVRQFVGEGAPFYGKSALFWFRSIWMRNSRC